MIFRRATNSWPGGTISVDTEPRRNPMVPTLVRQQLYFAAAAAAFR